MRILFVADGRSPIALNWMRYFAETGHEVHLVSTYPCAPPLALASLHLIPLAFGEIAPGEGVKKGTRLLRALIPLTLRTGLRQWLGPLTLQKGVRRLRQVIAAVRPDLIHAMRIPYEGMLAALALEGQSAPPLLISVWGNDFTLHAHATPLMAALTRQTLRRADALHADCRRDLRLAHEWGFGAEKPAVVLPGNGGIQSEVFYPPPTTLEEPCAWRVINPRGLRAYVRNDTFFRAIPLVLAKKPEVRFVCPAMAGEAQALRWVKKLGIASAVELLPRQSREEMAALFRQCQVAVSPTTHDGTPNTLLEAMACGCFPVAGDLESLREWITPGENGLLVDANDPRALAEAILQALERPQMRLQAREINTRLVTERADYRRVMREAETFYTLIV